jgi:hypothetical protein
MVYTFLAHILFWAWLALLFTEKSTRYLVHILFRGQGLVDEVMVLACGSQRASVVGLFTNGATDYIIYALMILILFRAWLAQLPTVRSTRYLVLISFRASSGRLFLMKWSAQLFWVKCVTELMGDRSG